MHGNPAEVFLALGFAAYFRKVCKNISLRVLGILPKFIVLNINYNELIIYMFIINLMINFLKISFGGIPNSRNVLFLQIFLKCAAKSSAGSTSAGFPYMKWSPILLNPTWFCTKAYQTFSGTSIEPDLALHQSLPDLHRNPRWTWPGACTRAHRNYSEPKTPLAYAVGEYKNIF